MAIKIGHASSDEEYRSSGGLAGDQNGNEVCIRTWYSSPWDVILRPKRAEVAERSAKAMEEACGNRHIGYDQGSRNTLYRYAKLANFDIANIKDDCETDCSALVHLCVICGGVDIGYGVNGHTTWTLESALVGSGEYTALREPKYLSSDAFLRRGDILLRTQGHVAMALENGAQAGAPAQTESVKTDSTYKADYNNKIDPAYKFDKVYAKSYTVTASALNLRSGADVSKRVLKVMPNGTRVTCYGYYTKKLDDIWLFVQTSDGTVGYCNKKYLA